MAQVSSLSSIEKIRSIIIFIDRSAIKGNKAIIHGKGGKYSIDRKEEKLKRTDMIRKRKSITLSSSKLGTYILKNMKKKHDNHKLKTSRKRKLESNSRNTNTVAQKRKNKICIENYNFKENKSIKTKKKTIIDTRNQINNTFGISNKFKYQKRTISILPEIRIGSCTTRLIKKIINKNHGIQMSSPYVTTTNTGCKRDLLTKIYPKQKEYSRIMQKYPFNSSIFGNISKNDNITTKTSKKTKKTNLYFKNLVKRKRTKTDIISIENIINKKKLSFSLGKRKKK